MPKLNNDEILNNAIEKTVAMNFFNNEKLTDAISQ